MNITQEVINYWNNRYEKGGNSGAGTSGDEFALKVKELRKLNSEAIATIVDVGCGDLRLGKAVMGMFPFAFYWGLDSSDFAIRRAQEEKMNPKRVGFLAIDNLNFTQRGDLVLCIDVLFHQLEDQVYDAMIEKLKNIYNKYLVLTEYSDKVIGQNTDRYIKYRKFDPWRISNSFKAIKIPYRSEEKILYIFEKNLYGG